MFHKILRNIFYIVSILRSKIKLKTYSFIYSGFKYEKGVRIDRGVRIVITDGGKLFIGENTYVDRFTNFRINGGNLKISRNSYIGEFCYFASNTKVSIGEGALIASHVVIRDNQHRFSDTSIPIYLQGNDSEAVEIGDNVWIGTKASVLMGVVIGENTIIGAHALVNSNLEPDYICAGIPCKPLRKR